MFSKTRAMSTLHFRVITTPPHTHIYGYIPSRGTPQHHLTDESKNTVVVVRVPRETCGRDVWFIMRGDRTSSSHQRTRVRLGVCRIENWRRLTDQKLELEFIHVDGSSAAKAVLQVVRTPEGKPELILIAPETKAVAQLQHTLAERCRVLARFRRTTMNKSIGVWDRASERLPCGPYPLWTYLLDTTYLVNSARDKQSLTWFLKLACFRLRLDIRRFRTWRIPVRVCVCAHVCVLTCVCAPGVGRVDGRDLYLTVRVHRLRLRSTSRILTGQRTHE